MVRVIQTQQNRLGSLGIISSSIESDFAYEIGWDEESQSVHQLDKAERSQRVKSYRDLIGPGSEQFKKEMKR